MKLKELQMVNETFVNLFYHDDDKREQYAKEVYTMLQNAYAPIGGLKGTGFASPKDMIENIPMWKLYKHNGSIKAVMMYKDRGGRKRVALATDNSPEGKNALVNMLKSEYAGSGRSFAEISGPSLRFHKKILGDEYLNKITIPSSRVSSILNEPTDEIEIIDDFEYKRKIGDQWITKRMLGTAGKSIT